MTRAGCATIEAPVCAHTRDSPFSILTKQASNALSKTLVSMTSIALCSRPTNLGYPIATVSYKVSCENYAHKTETRFVPNPRRKILLPW